MGLRSFLVAWLLTCAALLQPVALDGSAATVAVTTAVLLCSLVIGAALVLPSGLHTAEVAVPACRRLRGRFLQQTRPGVPGRTRARAPGCGR